ncbi:hypothetical protein S7711_03996 [Stachybotrys chartarum IBT 7711]|uniref:C2H2-type domain-containing protein n=1 Tax=Stachybotrys chartarum (strain CBS 109288 / IBT 7711) TaxID=1280523 RepID=A0A084AXE9_STACB|nr:hypothetical protein S7711_03996 [Stachybotrys chartarum IBT 7711]
MASIKNIINSDDEYGDSPPLKKDKSSTSGPFRDPPPPATHSGYTSTIPLPSLSPHSSAHDQRRSSPSAHYVHSLNSHTSNTSPGFPSTDLATRRRSNTSVDSMESIYNQTYHQAGPSHAAARPFMAAGNTQEPSVKLTPVTGRVSRAKKGVPVHICDQCRPPKTFTRAEHLRRHQLSHSPPSLVCHVPGCDKVFHRKDLLDRHQQRHDQDEAAKLTAYHTGQPPPDLRVAVPSSPNIAPGAGHSALSANQRNTHSMSYSSPPSGHGEDMAYHHMDHNTLPTFPSGSPDLAQTILPGCDSQWETNARMRSSPSGSSCSSDYGPLVVNPRNFSLHPQVPYNIPSYSYTQPTDMYYYPPQGLPTMPLPAPLPASFEGDTMFEHHHNAMNTTVCSLSPPANVQSSETLVAPAPAFPIPRISVPISCRAQATRPLANQHTIHLSLTTAARDAIPAYIRMYWDKVDPLYPVVHKNTFENRTDVASQQLEMLQYAMAAVATQFSSHQDDRIHGSQLHTCVRQKLRALHTGSGWSLEIMQTIFLCEFYARFRGRERSSYQPSDLFKALYESVSVLSRRPAALLMARNEFAAVPSDGDGFLRWQTWIAMETKRRLLAACFLLDVHCMCYHEQQPNAPRPLLDYNNPETLAIPMSDGTTQLWDASDARNWGRLANTQVSTKTVGDCFITVTTESDAASLPSFDASLLLAAHALALRGGHCPEQDPFTHGVDSLHMARLYPQSPRSNSYLALQFTPLHALLSISGDGWVLNKKVSARSCYLEHQKQLEQWQQSSRCGLATTFAARALNSFLGLRLSTDEGTEKGADEEDFSVSWSDISDYWSFYLCILICWACGYGRVKGRKTSTTYAGATTWLRRVAEMRPGQVQSHTYQHETRAVLRLGLQVLEQECLGGRNMLLADSVRVLKRLEKGGGQRLGLTLEHGL